MSSSETATRLPPAPPSLGSIMRSYVHLTGGFWRGGTARSAWVLTISCAILIGLNIGVQVGINEWNRYFFDALDKKDSVIVFKAIGFFVVLLLASTAVAIAGVVARMRMQVSWRQWLTMRLTGQWLSEQRFYRLNVSAPEVDAPEFRIAEDARVATEPVIDFGFGIVSALLMAMVFFSVLWTSGGSASIGGYVIPGFMVFAAIGYSVIMTGSMLKLGRPLIDRIERKNSAEAKLRQDLARLRENAESIAMVRGENEEISGIKSHLETVARSWRAVITQLAAMTFLTNTNGVAAPVVPLLLMAPGYLNGTITLGGVMQTAAAFVQVQVALNWLVDNYARIAEWSASASRVSGLWNALSDLDASVGEKAKESITVGQSEDGRIHMRSLSVAQHDGRAMIEEADTIIEAGEKVLLIGESGTGKSTLVRAVAGLWPWGSGQILLPRDARISFLPQTAYMPSGTLRQVLEYPSTGTSVEDSVLKAAMTRCGLKRFINRLDDVEPWDKALSGGEKQRLAFARLLAQNPDIVILDEATSALDGNSQDSMMELFRDELAHCTLISVAHRPELAEYHTRTLMLIRDQSGVTMAAQEEEKKGNRLSRLLRRSMRPRPSPDWSAPVSR